MKRKLGIILAAAPVLILAGLFLWPHHSQAEVVRGVFGGQNNYDAFMSSTSAKVQRVHYHGERDSVGDAGVLHDSNYTHEPPLPVGAEQLKHLKDLLSAPTSYNWTTEYKCIPNYVMVVHFHSATAMISVAFCLHCRQLLVLDSTRTPPIALNSMDNFDPIRDQLAIMAKTFFPKDSEIQALK